MDSLDDESIVVLGSSISKSLENTSLQKNPTESEDISNIQEYVKLDYNSDLNGHRFQLNEGNFPDNFVKTNEEPSLGSIMIASNIVSSCSAAEIQSKLANILDENNLLRETLKENNSSIKEQFKTIVSWRDDVMKTYALHKSKFAETKELIEKLKKENIQQKNELDTLRTFSQYNNGDMKTNLSYDQLVDDSKIDLLTSRLEVLEKENRKVLHENEDLRWQKDSLQNIVDNNISEIQELKIKIDILESNELQLKNNIKAVESKSANIQDELKSAQYKLSESENFKLEHSQYKQTTQNTIRHLKIEMQELKAKLRDSYILTMQPTRSSMILEENHNSEDFETFSRNIKIYDRTLNELFSGMNSYSYEYSELMENFTTFIDFFNLKSSNSNEEMKNALINIKKLVDTHHKSLILRNQQIRSSLNSFEKIFNDFQDIIKITKDNKVNLDESVTEIFKKNDEIIVLNNELSSLRKLITTLQKDSDQLDLFKAQIEVYRTDFETERKARTDIAAEKQSLVEQLRALHISKQKLVEDYDKYRRSQGSFPLTQEPSTSTFTEIYTCPICLECFEYANVLQEHANSCIDKNA